MDDGFSMLDEFHDDQVKFLIFYLLDPRRVVEGGRYRFAPLDMHPLEPEAGSNLFYTVNLHIYSDFVLFLSELQVD